MKQALADLLSSKKFLVGISSSVTAIVFQFGAKMKWEWLDVETANHISGIIVLLAVSYLGAQGAADHGKEREKEKPTL